MTYSISQIAEKMGLSVHTLRFYDKEGLLPDVQRTVFQLKYYEDMKYSDISKILGTSEGALKASYHIAVKKISSFLSSGD